MTTPPQLPRDLAFSAHDLLRVAPDVAFSAAAPSWVRESIARTPWLVVRRAPISVSKVPVGVRGRTRAERHGDYIDIAAIAECLRPEDLVIGRYGVFNLSEHLPMPPAAGYRSAALCAARALVPIFEQYGLPWGPTGSVGFECASGTPTATETSDLDLIIRCEQTLPLPEASSLLDAIERVSISFNACRVDANIETPYGCVSLIEYARTGGAMLMRTSTQPRMTRNPWSPIAMDVL